MLGTYRRFGQLVLKRISASATGSLAETDPVTAAAIKFMAVGPKLNMQERHHHHHHHRVDDKLKDQRKYPDDRFERALEKFSRSQESFGAEIDSFGAEMHEHCNDIMRTLGCIEKMLIYSGAVYTTVTVVAIL
jgi:hypothetical protein